LSTHGFLENFLVVGHTTSTKVLSVIASVVVYSSILLDDLLEVMRVVPEYTCNNRADNHGDPAAEEGEVDHEGALATVGLIDRVRIADEAKEEEVVEESASH